MASVRGFSTTCRILNQLQVIRHRGIHTTSVAACEVAPWNYIWKPSSKVPVTQKEKEIAAKKYGLIVEDYKPKEGLGEYPDLDGLSAFERDPHEVWDYIEAKRNFNEPGPYFNIDRDTEVRFSPKAYQASKYPVLKQYIFILTLLTLIAINHLYGPRVVFPTMPKQKPYDEFGKRVTNYSMEPAAGSD